MTVTYDFTGSVAVVTGAAGGMGRAVALAFAAAGAQVVAGDIAEAPDFDDAAVTYLRTDVSSSADVEALVATARDLGRLDCAVNAAAIEFETAPLAECPDDHYDRMMAVNARGVFLCLKHEIAAMLEHGGSIVNIASTNAFRPQANQPAYTASKHAVLGLTRSAAMDYASKGVRINTICPGAIDTPMLRSAMQRRGRDPREVAGRLSRFGRFGTPEEIAAAALWLCSAESSFTTGQALGVDGGMLSS
jgi:NAD(P)-dependent dehydrogenase (short-subunit alcohol dehydrogenase family)